MAKELTPEEVIQLQKDYKASQQENAELKVTLETQEQEHTATKEALTAEQAAHAATKEQLAESIEMVDELGTQLSSASTKIGKENPVVMHAKKEYEIVIPVFKHNNEEVTAESLQNNPELVAELIEMGSGVLQLKTV